MTAIQFVGVPAPAHPPDAAIADVLAAPLPDISTSDCQPLNGLLLGAFLRPHLHGLHPFLIEADLATGVDILALLPDEATVLRWHRRGGTPEVLATYDGCLVFVRSWRQSAEFFVSGGEREHVLQVAALLQSRAPAPPTERKVRVTFWHQGRCVLHRTRDLEMPTWDEVAALYPASVRAALAQLVAFRPRSGAPGGRLLLWHGPPGTGKTTAVRALFDAWRGWASAHVVSDAEQLLKSAEYMAEVLLDIDDDSDESDEARGGWRLVVIEDAEQLLRVDARERAGAALGRLLNTADGLLGQGSKALILLTTNERLDAMHPALLRPGRCMARVEFPPFTATEASALLGEHVSNPMTLAEVMERKGSLERLMAVEPEPAVGQYL